uniref:Uncharacterized protein n=1 Tax=Megaselia scalaris TaxID=36166 RepID=T1GKA8_MEGSC
MNKGKKRENGSNSSSNGPKKPRNFADDDDDMDFDMTAFEDEDNNIDYADLEGKVLKHCKHLKNGLVQICHLLIQK